MSTAELPRILQKMLNFAPTYGLNNSNHPLAAIVTSGKKEDKRHLPNKRSRLNRYSNTIAIDNLKEDVENYQLTDMVVYYYKTSKGHWRVHLHGYGIREDKLFYYESETMFGFDLLNSTGVTYAGKIARKLARDIGADYQGINKSFEGWK